MKAFSFLTILESLSKKLSILRTKMHSDNLRVDYESITSQLRVNPLFSHCASSGASFALSRRASHFAAILTILFTVGVGSVSAQETVTWDFSNLSAVDLSSGKSYSYKATDGNTEMRYSAGSNDAIVAPNGETKGYLKENGTTGSTTVTDIDGTTNVGKTRLIRLFVTGKGKLTINCSNNFGKYKIKDGSSSGTVLIDSYTANVQSEEITVESLIWIETSTKGYINSIEWLPSSSGGSSTISVTSVSLNKTLTTLEIGGTETLTATITPNNATNKNVSWTSSNTSVATVENGVVTAVAAGTATITVTTADGNKTATCAVTVNAASGGGSGDDSYMYFVAEADATANGVKNSQKFTGVPTGGSDAKGSFSFNGKEYTVEKRTGNEKHTIKFEMPDGWTNATLVLVHNQSSRNFTLYHPDKSEETGETKANGSFYENMFTITQSGTYTISNSENIGLIFIGLINNSSASTPTYSVTYDANGATSGSVPTDDDDYESGATVTVKGNTGNLAKTGYTFAGWNTKDDGTGINYTAGTGTFTISANTTLYAKWNAETYTITYSGLEGATHSNPATYTIESETITFTAPSERTGYTFAGWNPTSIEQGSTGNKTVTASWTVNTYTITYNINRPTQYENDETETDFPAQTTVTVNAGGTITLPNPSIKIETITVYTAKWKDASNNEYNGGAEITPTGDMTLTAYWTPQSWKIGYYESFDGTNLGTEITGLTPNKYTYGEETLFCADAEAIVQNANKTGYTWLGWWSRWSPDAQDPVTTATVGYSGEFSLFAKWEENTPVTPPTQGGEVTAMWPMVDGSDVSLVGNATHASITLSDASKNGDLITIEGTQQATYTDYTERMAIVKVSSNLNDKNESINANNYIKYTLTVAQGYTFTPTGFSAKIGKHGTDNGSAQVVLKKGNTTLGSTEISQPSRHSTSVLISVFEKTIDNASACVASETIDLYVYFGGKMGGKNFLISEVNIYGTYAPATDTPTPEPGTETCITLGSDNSKDIKSDGTATVGNYTITASGINWQSTSAKIDNDPDYIIITNSTGITAANVTAKSNILFVTYSSSIDGTESKTTEEVTATNDFTELTLDVPNGTKYIKLQRENGGSSIYVSEICLTEGSPLPSCTTPVLSNLENKTVCPGSDVTWTAIVNNTAALQDGETIAYQWNKKGNNTVLSNIATLTLENVTEATGGTYVVTATVSANGKASATATKEVKLTVTLATATPTITASASTVYAGNPVTLTATCVSSGVTYQWYTCDDAEGTNATAIEGATNSAYTLASAGDAGTHYYKVIVIGDDTHSCGTAEAIFPLVVSSSNSGQTTCAEIAGQFASGVYNLDTDFVLYGVNSKGNLDEGVASSQGTSRCGGEKGWFFNRQRFAVTFPVDVVSFSFMGYQATQRTVEAIKTTAKLLSENTEYQTIKYTSTVTKENNCQTFVVTPENTITAGTIVWIDLSNALNISEICYVPVSTADCTDPQVTATVDNATVCEGTENVTFTATNYADGATLQWQKKNGNNWDGISGATSATYTISSVTTAHAGQYRVIAEKGCKRMSEEIKLTVLTAPTFNTFADEASVMKGNALAISDVQATGATGYAWYKSTDNSFDAAADTKVGTSKDLLLAAASIPEAADQTFYLFCVASNSCGSVTSNAITVTVTPFVEEECATKGNEGDREFGFKNTSCGQDTYGDSKTPVWKTNSRNNYLTYTAPEGRYFATAKVTVAHSDKTKCGYAYSTDGGTTWTFKELEGLSATLTQKTIDLSELSETVNAFRISRNLQDGNEKDWGVTTGTFYLAEACFTYENACTETTLTAGSYNNEYNISTQMDFVEPTFTLKAGETTLEGQTLTYTSSNTAIATVDEEGNVEFEGMTGTVTITATFAGGEISEKEYCACQGSYTITVGCKDQAPEIVVAGTNLDGCNNSITLEAKMQDGTAFADGTFQWYRDGEAIEGATSASYEVVRAGTYTVSRTYTCTTMSSNSAVVTNENVEPEVERLTPFQYYHVDKTYSNQMKNRHLFAVTSYGTLNDKRYHLTATRNGETLDLSSSTAFFTIPSSDNAVDTVMIDLNELKGKYSANDKIVITCAPINSCHEASAITASITIHVIDQTPTLALICSGADGEGTRDTKTLVVGGDFLTGYNKADLCQQTGNKTFDPNKEWGFYTELKENYIVTPVNGYAEFNKLNYEPFDILLLTDYPKASKSEAAATILDDMAALCDYRPLLSLKAHMVAKSPSKWAAKGFTTSPVVPDTTSQYANIVCYAHPMFAELDDAQVDGIYHDDDDYNQLVYKILTGPGHEGNKGLQGFELKDADNFVTIGLIHYNATAAVVEHKDGEDTHTHLKWTPAADDRQLVAIAERQANIEARMILFAINCGAQSMQTPMGRQVLLTCLDYLLKTDPLQVADCRLTFDNGDGNTNWGTSHYGGTGTKGDGKWSTAANWGPEYKVVPGRNNDVRIAAPCTVDANEVEVLSVHITEDGSLTIPADKSFTARSTILRADENGNVYPTNVEDISLGSDEYGNASLILNNERGDTKAGVAMYSTAKAKGYSAAESTWQYIGTPHSDVQNAVTNYYNSWLYQYDTGTQGWAVIQNGGPLDPFRGYCITHPESPHTYWMEGTLTATTNQDITIPAGKFVVVANSWTAPIQINELTDDDMEGLRENTIYFFNTGSDPNQAGELNVENGRYAAGTYVSVPIHSAPYTGDSYIPSMQGFYVVGGGADGTLHLDYERHVRAPRTNTPSGPMHAPARRVAADDEPQVAKFLFRGTRYDDRLIILERPDFTRGYDSGWDGEQWGGNAAAPMSYVVTETRWDAVSAIPEYEGTVIAFRAGEDSEYTIHFDYDGMEDALYLLDTDTQIYTRVLKGNSYTFTCTDKAEHNRFILTRKAPQIATGTENINTGENAKAVKFIKDDKIFIFVNGMLYDATGKMVIR